MPSCARPRPKLAERRAGGWNGSRGRSFIPRHLEPMEKLMQVRDVMTPNPACCQEQATLQDAAKMLAAHDVGALPVIGDGGRLTGIVTDRDIALRGVAKGRSGETGIAEIMSRDVVTVSLQDDLETCCDRMETAQIRRVVVVEDGGTCCGMVAQADIARQAGPKTIAELLRDVSAETGSSRTS